LPKPLEKRDKPGLKSVYEGREQRLAGKFSRVSEKMWLAMGVCLAVILGGYWFFASRKLEGQKKSLLANRNAVAATIGAEWYPLRDRIEKFILAENGSFSGDFVDPSAKAYDLQRKNGIYLRVRVLEAKDSETLRRAAKESARDGFVGCLVVQPNPDLAKGLPEAGAFPEQPWNLRQAYASTRILTDDWVSEVRTSNDDLRLRVFEQQFDRATKEEIPLAARIIRQADYLLFVLDEDEEEARKYTDGGPLTSEALQTVPHPARVVLVDLGKDAVILRLRRASSARFESVSGTPVSDPEMLAAMQRQVNNCQLATEVKKAIKPN